MASDLTTGEWVANYVVESSIGSGGMGTVYRVRSREGQPFAMKIVNRMEGSSAEEFSGRLSREANVARVVRHPGLVKVHAHGLLDASRGYLVMDLLEGRDLDACLASQSLCLLEYVELLCEALEALEAAHSVTTLDGTAQPIVHRDLKPSNLFLLDRRMDGVRLKIVDFGLVRQHGAKTLTRAGAGFGTICYMAPEQFTGARTASPATDVWAVGVMLYEVVAGFRPFLTEDMASTLSAIGKGHPTRLDALVPGCPARYAALVDACLEPERDKRPERADIVLRELRALLDDPAFISFANDRLARDPEQRATHGSAPARTPTALAQTVQSDGPSPAGATPRAAAPRPSGENATPAAIDAGVARAPTTSTSGRLRVLGLGSLALVLCVGAAFSWRVATRRTPSSVPPGPRTAASIPAMPALSTRVTITIPPAFATTPLSLALDGRALDAPADAGGARVALVPRGGHTLTLASGSDVLARLPFEAHGAALELAFASPCPEDMVYVTAGDTDLEAPSASVAVPRARVTRAFCIDRDETTFERIEDWCVASDLRDAAGRDRACDAIDRCMRDADPIWRGGGRAGTDAWPQPCVGPEEALRFCVDRAPGARLPTGPEWLRAATGGQASRLPWSADDDASPSALAERAVVYAGSGSAYSRFERFRAPRVSGASPFGARDLVGSLAEWSCTSVADGRCLEPTVRGGSLLYTAAEIAEAGGVFASERGATATDAIGFRCVVDASAPAP